MGAIRRRDDTDRSNPLPSSVAAGNDHSLYLKSDGSLLWAETITDEETHCQSQIKQWCEQRGREVITVERRQWAKMNQWKKSNDQIESNGVSSVAAGSKRLYLKSDGRWAIGYNQLGDGTGTSHLSRLKAMVRAAWAEHSLYLKSDGGGEWGTIMLS